MIRTEPSEENSARAGAIRLMAVSGIDRLPHQGEFHREGSALAGLAVHTDLPGVLLNDAVGHGKPQPGATTVAGFRLGLVLGGEKRIVDAVNMFLRDARTGVGNYHLHLV